MFYVHGEGGAGNMEGPRELAKARGGAGVLHYSVRETASIFDASLLLALSSRAVVLLTLFTRFQVMGPLGALNATRLLVYGLVPV